MEAGKSISATKLHKMTGHTGEHLLKPTANYMKLKLIGRLPPCEVCAKAKIRQRNVLKKKIKKMPTKPGYRVFIDISSFKEVSRGGNIHWLIMVDKFSDYTHSFFLKKKSDQIKILPMLIKGIAKKHRIEIKRIRLDNSGENKILQKECDKQTVGIIFEFTAPGLTDGSFCRKQNTLYFRLCKHCEFMMCILIVDHQFNHMHPWCSWECMLPGKCSPGKRCHTFWNRNIVLLSILLGKVSSVPKINFVNCMV